MQHYYHPEISYTSYSTLFEKKIYQRMRRTCLSSLTRNRFLSITTQISQGNDDIVNKKKCAAYNISPEQDPSTSQPPTHMYIRIFINLLKCLGNPIRHKTDQINRSHTQSPCFFGCCFIHFFCISSGPLETNIYIPHIVSAV